MRFFGIIRLCCLTMFVPLWLSMMGEGRADSDSLNLKRERAFGGKTEVDERPIIREKSGLHYLAPKPISPGEPHEPFIKPDYHQAPVPPTEKYREAPKQSVPAAGKAPPGGRLTPLP